MTTPGPHRLAIIAGNGDLPRRLAIECARKGDLCAVVVFGPEVPDWATAYPLINAAFERLGALFDDLRSNGCASVIFAGGLIRPHLDPEKFDAKTLEIAPRLLPLIGRGDDATLGAVTQIFEDEGFGVIAAQDILGGLVAGQGVLGNIVPQAADLVDIGRAAEIVAAIGRVDVGQGAVVAQGLCLGVESLQGTDRMLEFVARTAAPLRPDPKGAKGVLFKGPKPAQDRRVDLPAIGPVTIENAHAAGLGGVAVAAGGVLLIDGEQIIARANDLGLFLFGLAPKG